LTKLLDDLRAHHHSFRQKVETDAANHQFGQCQLVVFSQAIGLLASNAIVYYSPMSLESINLTSMKERLSLCMTMAMQTF
jgi:hypothetical protein